MSSYQQVVKNGKFYYPASYHYEKQPHEVNIICDRCRRQQLKCCVGYQNSDLCMECVEITVGTMLADVPNQSPSQFQSMTRMIQGIFKK